MLISLSQVHIPTRVGYFYCLLRKFMEFYEKLTSIFRNFHAILRIFFRKFSANFPKASVGKVSGPPVQLYSSTLVVLYRGEVSPVVCRGPSRQKSLRFPLSALRDFSRWKNGQNRCLTCENDGFSAFPLSAIPIFRAKSRKMD